MSSLKFQGLDEISQIIQICITNCFISYEEKQRIKSITFDKQRYQHAPMSTMRSSNAILKLIVILSHPLWVGYLTVAKGTGY